MFQISTMLSLRKARQRVLGGRSLPEFLRLGCCLFRVWWSEIIMCYDRHQLSYELDGGIAQILQTKAKGFNQPYG